MLPWIVCSSRRNIFIMPSSGTATVGLGWERMRAWMRETDNALNKLSNANPFPKNQECGRDLANFFFGSSTRSLALTQFTLGMCVCVRAFDLSSLGLGFFCCISFTKFFPQFRRAFDDDTKHLIICYVTVLRARFCEFIGFAAHKRMKTRWL